VSLAPAVAEGPDVRRPNLLHGALPRNRLSAHTARALELAELDRYWVTARETVHRQVDDLMEQHQSELRRGISHAKLQRGDPSRKWIALTFDDGPHPGYSERILKILHQYDVPATFFLVGEMAERHPDLVRAEAAEGHSIANHTYHHLSLTKIPQDSVATEIKACGEVLRSITGKAPRLFRPPGGEYNDQVAEASEALGYRMILWTDDPGDYASPGADVILKRTVERVDNGGIILLHDGIEQTIEILPQLLRYLKSHGYECVTIDEMLERKAIAAARLHPREG
jgi:peptidoglycan/xylan/chitin deacetylase (PgdA/CDA1 family)